MAALPAAPGAPSGSDTGEARSNLARSLSSMTTKRTPPTTAAAASPGGGDEGGGGESSGSGGEPKPTRTPEQAPPLPPPGPSAPPPSLEALRAEKFRALLGADVVDLPRLREMSWSGIPPSARAVRRALHWLCAHPSGVEISPAACSAGKACSAW